MNRVIKVLLILLGLLPGLVVIPAAVFVVISRGSFPNVDGRKTLHIGKAWRDTTAENHLILQPEE